MFAPLWLVLAAAPTVTPFRTDVAPRVDPVFGDVAALRRTVDRFLALHAEMERTRTEFATAVHATLAQVAPVGRPASKSCPAPALAQYERALAAGGRYLALGRQLEARFREIRRSEELGDAAGLTPDYRWRVKKARELYLDLLRDYREMRVAFYDQLAAEMRHAGCKVSVARRAEPTTDDEPTTLNPSDPAAWTLDEQGAELPPESDDKAALSSAKAKTPAPAAAPSVWIEIDNSRCAQATNLTIDGVALGTMAGMKRTSVRTRSGPHELCVLPVSEKRTCGEPGTVRRAYLYEGWTLVVRCESNR